MLNRSRPSLAAALVLAASFHPRMASAEGGEADTVVLKDGEQLEGTVIRQEPGRFLILRRPNGREVTLSWDEIKRVESSARSKEAEPNETEQNLDIQGGGVAFSARTTFAEAEAKRQEWMKKGGGLVSFEIRGQGGFIRTQPMEYDVGWESVFTSFPTGEVRRGSGFNKVKLYGLGGGGGAGFRVAYMHMKLPDPERSGVWSALRIGSGLDAGFYYLSIPVPRVDGPKIHQGPPGTWMATEMVYGVDREGSSLMQFAVPLNLGYQVGLGSFDGAEWRGVALGISYAPSLSITKVKDADASTNINYLGAEVFIEILDKNGPLSAAAPEAHGKIFAFVLPPIGDLPFIVNVGGGAVWY